MEAEEGATFSGCQSVPVINGVTRALSRERDSGDLPVLNLASYIVKLSSVQGKTTSTLSSMPGFLLSSEVYSN